MPLRLGQSNHNDHGIAHPGRSTRRQYRRFAAAGSTAVAKVVFDYIDGGAENEITLRENIRAFEEVTLRPRQAVLSPL